MGGTTAFFDTLGLREAPSNYNGTVRIDLAEGGHTEHWLVEFDNRDVRVRREHRDADCVVHITRELFDRFTTCEDNWTAALFRGAYAVEGDLRLLSQFKKLLPGPPGAHHPRSYAPEERRRR